MAYTMHKDTVFFLAANGGGESFALSGCAC